MLRSIHNPLVRSKTALIFVLLATSLLGGCRTAGDGAKLSDTAFMISNDEISGFRLFSIQNDSSVKGCTGAFLKQNTVLMASHCLVNSANQLSGTVNISFTSTDGKQIKAIDFYRLKKGESILDEYSAPSALARLDMVILVFPENASELAGIKNGDNVRHLSANPVTDEPQPSKLYFVGHGVTKNIKTGKLEWSLAHGDTSVAKMHEGYFVANVPNPPPDGLDEGVSSDVNWAGVGSMVLNSNFELVGIVSSIQDNIVVKGQPAKGRFAFIADLRGPLARSLYKQAILCPKESGRHCAQRFPNAWIEGQQAIASADYANREGGRCPVRLTQTYDKNSEVLEKIELHGLERPCDIYSSVFENCVDNECWSNSTCESLTLQPAGFSLHTRGKSYSFGRLEHVKVAKLDETAPDFMPKGTSPCYRQVISEPHQIYCRKDGSKWLWFGAYFTWEQGQKLCSKYNYALPAGTQAKDFPSSTEVRTRFWTDDPAAKTLVPSRSYIDDSKKESPPQLKAGPLDGKFGAGVLCYCDPNQFR